MASLETYGPWALIVGGSEGIGSAYADILAEQGFNLVITGNLAEPVEAVLADLKRKYPVASLGVVHDLTLPDPLTPVSKITDDLQIGLLIYNAGSVPPTPDFLEAPLDDALRALRLNGIGQTIFAHHYGKKMKSRGRGGIILTGSNACVTGLGGLVCYAAAKAYTQIFAEGLWVELKRYGVDVLALLPGATRTPFLGRIGAPIDDPEFPAAYPGDVAAEALANLGKGPTYFASGSDEILTAIAGKTRAEAVEIATGRLNWLEL